MRNGEPFASEILICPAVSGGVPEEPVVDKNTGHLYEKRLVHKYVQVI